MVENWPRAGGWVWSGQRWKKGYQGIGKVVRLLGEGNGGGGEKSGQVVEVESCKEMSEGEEPVRKENFRMNGGRGERGCE